MSEVKQFRLPDVGEGLTEADIVSWHVKPGDSVTLNQVIVEIETAKAVVELPSPYEGVVTELLADEGATVNVGTPIIAVNVTGEAAPDGRAPATTDVPAGSTPAGTPAAAGPASAALHAPADASEPVGAARPARPTRSRPPLPRPPRPSCRPPSSRGSMGARRRRWSGRRCWSGTG